jgi:hypothetical protein
MNDIRGPKITVKLNTRLEKGRYQGASKEELPCVSG